MTIVYDFDKTLTKKDTLFDFFKFDTKKNTSYFFKIFFYFSCMIFAKFKLITNDRLKDIGIKLFLKNLSQDELKYKFLNYKEIIEFNFLFEKIDFSTMNNCFIISASFEEYLKPIFPKNVTVIGSTINDDHDKLSFNCYGNKKIDAIRKIGLQSIDLFYTDSISDIPLVKLAKKTILVKNNQLIECNSIEEFIRNSK